jgi:glycosyltransferase involved in cell wall biosynthesis
MDLAPESFTSDPPDKEDTLTFAFVGRLSSNKRPQDAIEAFKIVHRQFPEARLWVMGTGPMEAKLCRRAPEGVEFLGRVSDTEKLERLGRAHALLVTSVREGWGLVVTEAAAVGTLSVGYKVPGLCDSISASNGLLSNPDPVSLAGVIVGSASDLMTVNYWPRTGGVKTWGEVAFRIIALVGDAGNDNGKRSGPKPVAVDLSIVGDANGRDIAG